MLLALLGRGDEAIAAVPADLVGGIDRVTSARGPIHGVGWLALCDEAAALGDPEWSRG